MKWLAHLYLEHSPFFTRFSASWRILGFFSRGFLSRCSDCSAVSPYEARFPNKTLQIWSTVLHLVPSQAYIVLAECQTTRARGKLLFSFCVLDFSLSVCFLMLCLHAIEVFHGFPLHWSPMQPYQGGASDNSSVLLSLSVSSPFENMNSTIILYHTIIIMYNVLLKLSVSGNRNHWLGMWVRSKGRERKRIP